MAANSRNEDWQSKVRRIRAEQNAATTIQSAVQSRLDQINTIIAASAPSIHAVGYRNAKGRYDYPVIRASAAEKAVARHRAAQHPLAAFPIPFDGRSNARMTRWVRVDLDDHNAPSDDPWVEQERRRNMMRRARAAHDAFERAGGKPYLVISTGGRGVHGWVVWDQWVDAASAIAWARTALEEASDMVGEFELVPERPWATDEHPGSHASLPFFGDNPGLVQDPDDATTMKIAESVPPLMLTSASAVPIIEHRPAQLRQGGWGQKADGREEGEWEEDDEQEREKRRRLAPHLARLEAEEALDRLRAGQLERVHALDCKRLWLASEFLARSGEFVWRKEWLDKLFAFTDEALCSPKHEEVLYQIFDKASQLAAKLHRPECYDPEENRTKWDEVIAAGRRKGGKTIAYIYWAARQRGWKGDEVTGMGTKETILAAAGAADIRAKVTTVVTQAAPGPETPTIAMPATEWDGGSPTYEEAMEGMAEKHFILAKGGKALCGKWTGGYPDLFSMMPPREWSQFYANQFYREVKKSGYGGEEADLKPAWPAFMKYRRRPTFDSIDMIEPGQPVPEGTLNTYRGLGVAPVERECLTIKEFIYRTICAGNRDHAHYLLRLLAWKVQHPLRPAEVGVVLRGGRGTGKSTFLEKVLRPIFHPHTVTLSNPRHLTGDFNRLLENMLLVGAEEAFWARNHKAEGMLKHYITGEELQIERKGLDPYPVKNRALIVMCSNEEYVVPAGSDERRFLVLDVSNARHGDRAYWKALRAAIPVELAGFVQWLLCLDLRRFNRRTIPQTDALLSQKEFSLTPFAAFWLECLREGRILGMCEEPWRSKLPREDLRDRLYTWMDRRKDNRDRPSATEVGMALRRVSYLGHGTKKVQLVTSNRSANVRGYLLGTLDQHRRAMAQYLRADAKHLFRDD